MPKLAVPDEFSSPPRSPRLPPPGGNNADEDDGDVDDDDVDDGEDDEHEGDNERRHDPPILCPSTKRFVSSGDAVKVY